MVSPTSDAGHFGSRLKLFFVVLVGVSAGLITRVGDATLLESALVVVLGLGVGVVLVWIVFPGNKNGNDRTSGR
ncbi:hypothetical protein [Halocatena marina]|uniref:Uncharacterized protein n=1 Tax=Halocatena marina TaxID=2934937 RepID=A0ABD5YML0_9EURY|nr:hypothetical protein [Halocatena marina]